MCRPGIWVHEAGPVLGQAGILGSWKLAWSLGSLAIAWHWGRPGASSHGSQSRGCIYKGCLALRQGRSLGPQMLALSSDRLGAWDHGNPTGGKVGWELGIMEVGGTGASLYWGLWWSWKEDVFLHAGLSGLQVGSELQCETVFPALFSVSPLISVFHPSAETLATGILSTCENIFMNRYLFKYMFLGGASSTRNSSTAVLRTLETFLF